MEVTCDASGSIDPDGAIVAYNWDFGDGERADGVVVTHTFQDDGQYTVTLTVRDDKGATGTAAVQVEVRNPPPMAQFTYSPEAPVVGEVVTFDANSSTDPASLPLKPERIVSYHWNFGDGSEGNGRVVRHTYMAAGTFTVILTVTDDDGATATAEAQVEVAPPQPPPPPSG